MSTNPRIYLDYNATMPIVPAAREAIRAAMEAGLANPSSVHADGRKARDAVERARDAVARLVGRPREQVVFTSGGTEANALGILGLAAAVQRRGGPRVVASAAIDHPSVLGAVDALVERGWEHRVIAVDAGGCLVGVSDRGRGRARDTWHVHDEAAARDFDVHDRHEASPALDGVGLLVLSAVNHELGTVADHATWIAAARAAGALVHVDAVQLAGKRAIELDADAIAISGHKLGAPAGVGALIISLDDGLPVIEGGHQERERRPGTENTLGIVGLGAAIGAIDLAAWPRVVALGERLEAGLRALGARIHGHADRIGGTINAAFPGALGESIVIALDLAGISVSTGAACTSGSIQPSRVLLALGQSAAQAREAVRFSLSTPTTAAEIDAVLAALPAIVERARLTKP